MANQQAILITYLKDILFSEAEITANIETRAHIFEMHDKDGSGLGFISLYDLKAYVHEHEEEAADYLIKAIDAEKWVAIFEHPYFQRRKPQLVSLSSIEPESDLEYFILKNGQKNGPFQKTDLESMLDEKEILLTDMVSYNAGHTWMKLFQVENFDRRVLGYSDQLPGVPSEVLSKTDNVVIAMSPATDAISSLAYLSNVKRGKTIEREKIETYQADVSKSGGSTSMYKWILILSVIGIGFFLYSIKNQLMSPFKNSGSAIGEQAQMLTPIEMDQTGPGGNSQIGERNRNNQVNNQGRSGGKFQARKFQPIRPGTPRKSFMDTGSYQAIQDPGSPGEQDPNYFYDNSSAMELDPVRSQVSKENFDDGGANPEGPIPSSDNLFESEVTN